MTREEEINNASYAYWVNNYANIEFIDEEEKELHTQDIQESFINGAEWADQTMIEKACDWLYEFNRKQTNKMFGIVNTADVTINVAEFRKAMEGD